MGVRWKGFEIPKSLVCDTATLTSTYGVFVAEPFERGFGQTLGNSLRRVLVGSLEGAAVTSVKFDGVLHEFATIPNVYEDVSQIILNIKKLVLRSHASEPKWITLDVDKKGDVTAADLQTDPTIEVINTDHHICTLTKKSPLKMELEVCKGRGYAPVDRLKKNDRAIGVIPIDASFSPVRRVNFRVEDTRVGQMTDYDRLILEIWTSGAMTPEEAILYASHTLSKHLEIFVNYGELPKENEPEQTPEQTAMVELLQKPISELELSVRSANCLKAANIRTIGDLVQKSEPQMLKYRNFGRKSLSEITKILEGMGLSLGMKLGQDLQTASQVDREVPEEVAEEQS